MQPLQMGRGSMVGGGHRGGRRYGPRRAGPRPGGRFDPCRCTYPGRVPAGSSPALLFRLPGYAAPYTLTVTSLPRGLGTWQLFVPAVVLLDSEFQPVRDVPEADFVFKKQTFSKSQRLEGEIAVDESLRNARYVFMYTNAALIGEMYGVHESKAYGTLVAPVIDVKLMRSLHGSVEIEARLAK